MRAIILGYLTALMTAVFATGGCGAPAPAANADQVVLLHGLGRTDRSMARLEHRLAERGYAVTSIAYPSRAERIEDLARDELGEVLAACCADAKGQIHFVTHSMGGIVLRFYLSQHEVENLGRVVMLSPPNAGSELADWAAANPLMRSLLGPAVEQLGTDSTSLPNRLGPVDFELGIITGDRSLNPIFSDIIPGEDDGKVAVERARVGGMTDFLVVPYSHSYIMLRGDVIDQVVRFLEHGEFQREEGSQQKTDAE